MGAIDLTARLVTQTTRPQGSDLPVFYHTNGCGEPGPISRDSKVVFLFPGQGSRGAGHGLVGAQLVEGMLSRGYNRPLGAIGSSSGGPAAADVGIAALGEEANRITRELVTNRWLAPHELLTKPADLLRSLVPGPQYKVRDRLIASIDFRALMRSPTTVGVIGAENRLADEAGPIFGALGGLALTLGQYLVHPDNGKLAEVAASQFGDAMKSLRHAWRPVGWVNHLPPGVTKPDQVSVVDMNGMIEAMMATMNLPGLYGRGHPMVTGPDGKTTRILDGAIAMGAAVTEAVLLGATDIIVVTDSPYANIHWNDISAAILKGVCHASRMAEGLPIPSRRLKSVIAGTTRAFHNKLRPRDVVRTMDNPRINPDGHGVRLYALPVLPDHFPKDLIRFGEFRRDRLERAMDVSEAMARAALDVLFPA